MVSGTTPTQEERILLDRYAGMGKVRSQWYTILSVGGSMVRPVPGCEKILSRTEAEERLGFLRDTNPSLRVFLSLVSQTSEYECTLMEGA